MNLPMSLQSTAGIVALAAILGLFWWMSQRRRQAERAGGTARPLPEMGFACEWVSTPLAKAKKDMLQRFPELEATLAGDRGGDVHLIRFGLFNMREAPLEPAHLVHPVELVFPDHASVLSARFGEALKTTPALDSEPAVEGPRVILPVFRMDPRSTVIFNLIVRGSTGPSQVFGEAEGHGPLKRIS